MIMRLSWVEISIHLAAIIVHAEKSSLQFFFFSPVNLTVFLP